MLQMIPCVSQSCTVRYGAYCAIRHSMQLALRALNTMQSRRRLPDPHSRSTAVAQCCPQPAQTSTMKVRAVTKEDTDGWRSTEATRILGTNTA